MLRYDGNRYEELREVSLHFHYDLRNFVIFHEKFEGLREKLRKYLKIASTLTRSARTCVKCSGMGRKFRSDSRRNEASCGMG